MQNRGVPAAAAVGISTAENTEVNSGNAQAPGHSAGVTHNSQSLESTSGTPKPLSGSKGGRSVVSQPAPSSLPANQKKRSSGHRSSASPGQAGGRQQKSEASTSKQPSAPQRVTKAGKDVAPEPSTLPTSKTLQARVDSIQAELSKQRVSSESGTKANTLLRDLLSYAMRCESKQA